MTALMRSASDNFPKYRPCGVGGTTANDDDDDDDEGDNLQRFEKKNVYVPNNPR